jgi:hypothetical protein
MIEMDFRTWIIIAAISVFIAACSGTSNNNSNISSINYGTPGNAFTPLDIAKLKWIEGTWRGMDGDKPFYERYRLEDSALVVDSFTDETLNTVETTGRFELKNGEFGKTDGARRSAAISITNDHVQFGPVPGSEGNYFRFERRNDETWNAILEWPASGDKAARQKIYKMEPVQPSK